MIIEIQTTIPDMPYSKAGITLNDSDCDNGKTVEQNITRAIEYQKAILSKYKD